MLEKVMWSMAYCGFKHGRMGATWNTGKEHAWIVRAEHSYRRYLDLSLDRTCSFKLAHNRKMHTVL